MKVLVFLIIVATCLSSCSQLGSLQTARTLPPDDIEFGGALYGYGFSDQEFVGGELGSYIGPHFEILGRYGIADNIDAGIKLSSSLNLLIDGKFQFLGGQTESFAMAIGPGFEYQFPVGEQQEETVFRVHLPLYMSYHFNDDNALYLTPRYTLQYVSNDDNNNNYFVGSAFGFEKQINNNLNGIAEVGYYLPFTENKSNDFLYQIALGLKYRFNN